VSPHSPEVRRWLTGEEARDIPPRGALVAVIAVIPEDIENAHIYYVREFALQTDNLREVEVSVRRGVSELISQYAHVLFESIQTEPPAEFFEQKWG